jgi:hypothetical protein
MFDIQTALGTACQVIGYRYINSVEQSLSEANSSSAGQEIPRVLWNLEVYCRVHRTPPSVHILNQINQVHTLQPYF